MPIMLRPIIILSLMNILMMVVMLTVIPAQGMVYMWRDAAGVDHYSNKEYDIPARYKAKTKALYPEASDSGQIQPLSGNVQASSVVLTQPIANQQAMPAEQSKEQPDVTAPQSKNTTQRTVLRREKRQRTRSAEDE